MKSKLRKMFVMLVFSFVLSFTCSEDANAAIEHSGNHYGVKYTVDSEGVLTVSPGGRYETNWGTVYESGDMGGTMEYTNVWKSYADEITKIVIEDGIEVIPEYAFQELYNATELELGGSIKTIKSNAFIFCEKLESLTFPESVRRIEDYAFAYCGFENVTIPAGLEYIGLYTFKSCYNLEKVVFCDGVERIDNYMFHGCSNLKDVTIPDTIRFVHPAAFEGTALVNDQIAAEAEYIICDGVLLGCTKGSYYIDDPCIIPEGITCIADDVFREVTISGVLEFPESLVSIGNGAFYGRFDKKYISDLDLKNVTHIGNNAFFCWDSLHSVDLSNVVYLGDEAFAWCNYLTSARMAKEMEYIGESVFYDSGNYSDAGRMTEIEVPERADYVTYASFLGTPVLDDDFDGVDDGYYYCNNMLLYISDVSSENAEFDYSNGILVADGTHIIADRAIGISQIDQITSMTIPESVKVIGSLSYALQLKDVYYAGDRTGWDSIKKLSYSEYEGAAIHCAKEKAISLNDCEMKLGYSQTTYNGKAKTPGVTVIDKNGKSLKKDVDFKVIYSNNKNAGKATVTVTGQGKYCDTLEKTFTISSVKAANVTAKLDYAKTTFNGKQKTPGITATDKNGLTLTSGKDYTVTYSKKTRKVVGRYKVTITLKGNYTGTKTFWFTIVPSAPSTMVLTLSPEADGYNDIILKWDQSIGADGYYLYYKKGTAKNWSNAIDCGLTRIYTKKNLANGTKYSFKVIPYYKADNGTKYTSLQELIKTIHTLKKVTNVTVNKSSGTKVKITWADLEGESGYQIQRMTAKNQKYTVQQSYTKEQNTKTITIAPKKGTKYYYRVRAYKVEKINGKNTKIYGPWSIVKPFKLT